MDFKAIFLFFTSLSVAEANVFGVKFIGLYQHHPEPYIFESTFLFLEQSSPQASLNFHCNVLCFVELCCAVLYCIILHCMAYSARESRSPQFLKIKRYAQRLSHRVCMGDEGSG